MAPILEQIRYSIIIWIWDSRNGWEFLYGSNQVGIWGGKLQEGVSLSFQNIPYYLDIKPQLLFCVWYYLLNYILDGECVAEGVVDMDKR